MTELIKYRIREWHVRRQVLESALEILSDGHPYTARHILDQLAKRGFTVPKRLINSVLFSEGRRYVLYDKKSFTYRLREADPEAPDPGIENSPKIVEQKNSQREIRARYIGRNDEYVFTSNRTTSPAFFETSTRGSTTEIILNENHPIYDSLATILDLIPDDYNEVIYQRLIQAQQCIKLLIAAWSSYEHDQPEGPRRYKVEEARLDWGRNIRAFLMNDREEE